MDYNLSYREVIPDQTLPEYWKEISLNTGKFTIYNSENNVFLFKF